MSNLKEYHILISHSWDYDEQYKKVRDYLDEANYFKWKNYSVPITKPIDVDCKRELKEKLREKISQCSGIIVLAGMYVDYSEWIDFEIDTAVAQGKPIIGVKPWGQERIPAKVQNNAVKMVGWNSSSIVQAVRDYF